MKRTITLTLLLFALKGVLIAQTKTNCWVSDTYNWMDSKPGVKPLKGPAVVCFNNSQVSAYTPTTGLISFGYTVDLSELDTLTKRVTWHGTGGGDWGSDWGIYMVYNDQITIGGPDGWSVQLTKIKHTSQITQEQLEKTYADKKYRRKLK